MGSKLLDTFDQDRLIRDDENIKAIGYFLYCLGESIEHGSYSKAVQLYKDKVQGPHSLGIAFCITGLQVSDWSTGLYLQKAKTTREAKKTKAPRSISKTKKGNR